MDTIYKALADPTRRRILDILKKGSRNAGEIGAEFQMTGASVSHHLSLLKAAGLVASEKKGQQVIYTLDTTVLQDLMIWIGDLKGGNK